MCSIERKLNSLKALHLECITNSLLKAQTSWSCLIGKKFNSLKRGEVVQVVVVFGVVDLRKVDEEQAGSPETVVVDYGVDEEQAGLPEEALGLEFITNGLVKAQTFWSRLMEKKWNSLKRDEVVQVPYLPLYNTHFFSQNEHVKLGGAYYTRSLQLFSKTKKNLV